MAGTRVLGIGALNGVDSYSSPSYDDRQRAEYGQGEVTAEQYLKFWFWYRFHIRIHIDIDVNVHDILVWNRGAKLLRHYSQLGSHVERKAGGGWVDAED
jgi:hypothetical protein